MMRDQWYLLEDSLYAWLDEHGATLLLVACFGTLGFAYIMEVVHTGNIFNPDLAGIVTPIFLALIFSGMNRC